MPEFSAVEVPAHSPRVHGWARPFSWECEPGERGSVRLCLVGELDLSDRPRLRLALTEAGERATSISVDLGGLTFIDCAAIATLLDAAAEVRLRGGGFDLLGASGQVERVLESSGIPAEIGRLGLRPRLRHKAAPEKVRRQVLGGPTEGRSERPQGRGGLTADREEKP